jgi:hypothetical protein
MTLGIKYVGGEWLKIHSRPACQGIFFQVLECDLTS